MTTEVTQTKSTEYQQKQSMRIFVEVLLSSAVLGNKSLAERISGVKRQNFLWHMRVKPEFRIWFEAQCDRALMSRRANVDRYLLKQIVKGDISAIRTYYEMIGKLKNKIEHSGSVQGGETNVNVNVYPQKTIVFQDVKPNGDEQSTDRMINEKAN